MEVVALNATGDVLRRVRTLADIATEQLRQEIISGNLSPGAPLLLQEISESLGMSITPVREALGRLSVEGFVEVGKSRAARVALLQVEELEDVYSMRLLLEVNAIRAAVPRMDDAAFERIGAALEQYRKMSELEMVDAAREAHQAFHFAIYQASGSNWSMRLIEPLWNNSERYQRIARAFRGSPSERVREHSEILEACEAKDSDQAAHLLGEHLRHSIKLVRNVLEVKPESSQPEAAASIRQSDR